MISFSRAIPSAFLLAFLLGSCLSRAAIPTPILTSTPPAPTATFDFPTLIPTATLTPPPSPTPTADIMSGLGPLSFYDDFSSDRGWQVKIFGSGGAGLLDGRYSLSVREPFSIVIADSPAEPMQNGYLEVVARTVLCSQDDEYGLVFRSNGQGEYYRFSLNCAGEARLSRITVDGEHVLIPNTPVNFVFPGLLVDNRLGVLLEGETFRFFVNGSEVLSARDRVLPLGGTGLFVRTRQSGQTTALFDDFTLRPPKPLPALTASPDP
ncbi:MAG: hypothetical protein P8X64_04980 [Anaerolineales bacterium]|jgi:hypothetical protein